MAGAVVFNVYLCAGFGNDSLNNFSAAADNFSYLICRDHVGHDLRSKRRKFFSRSGNCFEKNIVDDMLSARFGLFERLFDDVVGQTVNLNVHLNGRDTVFGSGNLEVHIAVEVFKSLNVNHGQPLVVLGYKTAADTRNGTLYGNARVHKSEGRTANGALRGRTVGRKNFGNETDSIRELFFGGKNGFKASFGKSAVAYFTSARAAAGLCVADGITGHIVMVHISLGIFFVNAVELLFFGDGSEGRNGENLRLTSREKTRTVNSGKNADFGMKRSDLFKSSAVNSSVVVKEPSSDDFFLNLVKNFAVGAFGIFFVELLTNFFFNDRHVGVSYVFIVGIKRFFNLFKAERLDVLIHIVVEFGGLIFKLGFAYLCGDVLDEANEFFQFLMRKDDTFEHDVVGHFVCTRFYHNNLFFGRGDGDHHLRFCFLFKRRVKNVFAVNIAEYDARNGSVPGNVGDCDGNGSAVHRGYLGRVIVVDSHRGRGNNDVVSHVLREERSDGSVDNSRSQNSLFAGLTLSFEEAAGDFSDRVKFFFIVNSEREEIYSVSRFCRSGRGCENAGIPVSYHTGTVCKACELASLNNEGSARKFGLEHFVISVNVHVFLL